MLYFFLFLFSFVFIYSEADDIDVVELTEIATEQEFEDEFLQRQENISSLSRGIVRIKGTNEPIFAVNADNPERSGGMAGFAVYEKMNEVASLRLNDKRSGWLLLVPEKKSIYQPIHLGLANGNIFLGFHAGLGALKADSVILHNNIGIGVQALYSLQNSEDNKGNIAVGKSSGIGLKKGMYNVCIGVHAMAGNHKQNAPVVSNTSHTNQALVRSLIVGSQNIAIGALALSQLWDTEANFKNDNNIAIGTKSLYTMSLGNNNVAIGNGSLSVIHQNHAKAFDRHRYYEALQSSDRFYSTTEYENLVGQPSSDVLVKHPLQKTRLAKGAGNIAIGPSALSLYALTSKQVQEFNNLGLGVLAGCNRADNSINSIFMLSPGREEEKNGTFIANIRPKSLVYGTHHGVYVDEFDQLGLSVLPESEMTMLPESTFDDIINNELPALEVFAGTHSADMEKIIKYGIKSETFTQDNSPIKNLRLLLVYDKNNGSTMGVDPTLLIPVLLKAYQELKASFDQYVATHP